MVIQAKNHRSRKSLGRDEEGAILVGGMFVSAFLIGVLYMLVGASTAMQHGELMQDGADSAAFSSAQMHAKGMNLIAVSNMVKVAGAATIVAPPSIAIGAGAAIGWIASSRWRKIRYGWTIPFLKFLIVEATLEYTKAQRKIPKLIAAAHNVQNVIASDLPAISEHVVNRDFVQTFSPPVTSFFLSPLQRLPIEEEKKLATCLRMTPYALNIVRRAFKRVPSRKVRRRGIAFSTPELEAFCLVYAKPAMLPTGTPGTEGFQVRAYAAGEDLSDTGEKGIRVATWGADNGPDGVSELRDQLSTISFAQAEYYYSGRVNKKDALFHSKWKARLRRFRPNGGPGPGDCARRGGPAQACEILPAYLNEMQWATVH